MVRARATGPEERANAGGMDPVVFGLGITADDHASVLYTGPGHAALFGREPGDARSAVEVLGLDPAAARSMLDSIRASLRTGEPWRFAWRVRRTAGQDIEVEALGVLVTSPDGSLVLHGFARAVKRDEIDADLANAAARFRSIVEASPVPYAINDDEQNITYVNPAFVATFGYSREDIPTLADWWPLAYPDPEYRQWVIDEWRARVDRARAHGTPFEFFEVKIQAKDGTLRFAVVGALSLDRSLGGLHVVALLDVTERKLAEEARLSLERQVQHSQKLESLGILAGGIAHDFNNLLMAILGNAELALTSLPEPSPARSSVQAIQVSARRASEVADQMLAYSGKGKFVVARLSLSELVAEMSQLLEVAISKNVTLRMDLEVYLPRFDGDATQVRQVVMNLLTNAAEAIGDRSGVVTLSTGVRTCDRAYLDSRTIVRDDAHRALLREGSYVYLSVADTGCGMTPETKAKIFEPFFTTKFTGRGLGLSALLGIVSGHAGAIEVCSELGKGTTVRVLFPVSASVEPAASTEVHARPAATAGRGLILLVDDEEAIRNAVKRMLEYLGFDVALAVNGRDAIDVFRERQRDIAAVILDLTMPGLSGEQTFRQLRDVRADVKVILSSGYTSFDVSRRFTTGDLAGFLKKPFDVDELDDVVSGALRA